MNLITPRKIIIFLIIALALFFLLLSQGYIKLDFLKNKIKPSDNFFTVMVYRQYANNQYRNGFYEEAEKAFLEYVDLLNQANDNEKFAARNYDYDIAIAYGHLAISLEKQDKQTEADYYMEQAVSNLSKTNWGDIDEEKIRSLINTLDGK